MAITGTKTITGTLVYHDVKINGQIDYDTLIKSNFK